MISDPFVIALNHLLLLQGRGSRRALAGKIKASPALITEILKQRTVGTEKTRREIAAALGYEGAKYEDFLNIGRAILAGEPLPENMIPIDIVEEKPKQPKELDEETKLIKEVLEHFKLDYKTQKDFAAKLGMSPGNLNDIFADRKPPGELKRRQIATALGYEGEKYYDLLEIGRKFMHERLLREAAASVPAQQSFIPPAKTEPDRDKMPTPAEIIDILMENRELKLKIEEQQEIIDRMGKHLHDLEILLVYKQKAEAQQGSANLGEISKLLGDYQKQLEKGK